MNREDMIESLRVKVTPRDGRIPWHGRVAIDPGAPAHTKVQIIPDLGDGTSDFAMPEECEPAPENTSLNPTQPQGPVLKDALTALRAAGADSFTLTLGTPSESSLDHIRPEIKTFAERGNVTWEELNSLHVNSYEQELLYTKLTSDALIQLSKLVLKNCTPWSHSRPCLIYDDVAKSVLMPELMRRLEVTEARLEYRLACDQAPGSWDPCKAMERIRDAKTRLESLGVEPY
jgi:hypothetical protein